jgi:hypothetical protein
MRRRRSATCRRAISLVAALAYLVTAGGFPLPSPLGALATSNEAFPCRDHACGCRDARQCWTDCCCYSPRERLAWAARNDVRIHAELAAQLESFLNGKADAAKVAQQAACPHCAHDEADHGSELPSGAAVEPQVAANVPSQGHVFGNLVRVCRGFAQTWVACGAVTVATNDPAWQFDPPPAGSIAEVVVELSEVSLPPDAPPPRA